MNDKLGHNAGVTTSIGIALYPYHGFDVQTLMKHANMAVYRAKEAGKNQHCLYSDTP